ncbi:hypothetical protein ASG22_08570 [Chryseobacterium sp. Leaf405]|uniref:EpsG family protein n=1 Tax=Chryseobacterium sp. Leaf405 TaxID=1736367 RepID=UPI0006F4EF94|nr:hypothetical protein ASG22_08570 [Chryseobacterium sp. Leaf405]
MIIIAVLLFIFLSLFSLKSQSIINKNICFIFCLVFWWFLESFRWESGTDYWNYINNFQRMKLKFLWTDRYELGYNLMVLFFRDYLKTSFTFFIAVYYLIVFILYYFSIRKATQKPLLFIFIFFCFVIGLMGSTRQLMALSIMFFGSIYFLEKKKLWFILTILLASLFHRTIIVCLVFVFFTNHIKYKYWFYMIAAAFITQISGLNMLVMENLIVILPKSFSERFFSYLSMSLVDVINMKTYLSGIFRRLLPIILLFIYKDKLTEIAGDIKIRYVMNILFFSLFSYIILSFNFTFIISRISIYFNIFEVLFYVWLITMFIEEKKYIYILGLVAFFLILCIKYIMYYPHLFLPYKTIFFTL